MTEDNNKFNKQVDDIIKGLDDLDTSAFDINRIDDQRITNFSEILSTITKNPDLAIGTEIGQWKIQQKLGQGGMSIVYQVKRNDPALKQQAALKIIPQSFATEQMIKRFLRERQILSDLNHNNIAKLYDVGVTNQDIPWFVMELVKGKDILSYANDHQFNVEQRVILFRQVCDALGYAHSHGIIHRDIKPNNLMVSDEGVLKLLDFGIASTQQEQPLTMTGAVIGTPGYMSPEQAKGITHELDRRSDIFSLGVLLYKLIKRTMPFEADSVSEVCYRIIHDEPTTMGSETPIELQAIIHKCLEKKIENRYQSVQDLHKDLNAYLNGEVVSARKITLMGRFKKKVTKHPLISTMIGTAMLITVLGVGYGIYQSYKSLYRIQAAEKHLSRAQEIKAKVRRTHMMPLHNVIDEYEEINNDIIQLKNDIESAQTDTSGLSSFALGSAYLSMRDFDQAFDYFKMAEQKGWNSAELASGLGITLAKEWEHVNKKALAIKDSKKKQQFLDQKSIEIFQPAITYLQQAQISDVHSDYLMALLSWVDEDPEAAIQHTKKEILKHPWHYEAHNFVSGMYAEAFIIKNNENGYDSAKNYLLLSNQHMDQAIAIGSSDPYNYSEYCSNLGFEIQLKLFYEPDQLNDIFDKGMQVCQDALALAPDPKPPGIYRNINYLYNNKALYEEQFRNPTIELYENAYEIANQGLMIHPNDPDLLRATITPLSKIGQYNSVKQLTGDDDPSIYYNLALKNIDKSLNINPTHRTSWSSYGSLQNKMANYYRSIHDYQQADHYYNQAIISYNKVIELGNRVSGMANIATNYVDHSDLKFKVGQIDKGIDLINQAVTTSEEIFTFNKDYFVVYSNYLEFQFKLVRALRENKKKHQEELKKGIEVTIKGCQLDDLKNNQITVLKNIIDMYTEAQLATQVDFFPCQKLLDTLNKDEQK